MNLLLAKVSLDDFQLKIRNLLRNSKYRDSITTLPKGTFVYPETDQLLTVKPFQQDGTPYQWQPKTTEQTEQQSNLTPTQQKFKSANIFKKGLMLLGAVFGIYYSHNEISSTDATKNDTSEGDALLTLPESDILLPPDNEEF